MAHTKLFIAFFFAILVGLSIENDNFPQEIDYDTILNEQIDLCKKEVEKRKFKWPFKTVYDWHPEGATFVHDDAHYADFHQGNSNNSWLISAASALMATGWINNTNKDNIKARFFFDLFSFWRGTFRDHSEDNKRHFYRQTLDIVQPKTSYIANIVWHKYPPAQYVRFSLEAYKDFSDRPSTSVKALYITKQQTKLPESARYDVIYKSITPLIEMPKCRHNVVA